VVLSKRERYIVILTLTVVGILALDYLFVTPLLDRRTRLGNELTVAEQDVLQQRRDMSNATRARRKWRDVSGGTVKRDTPEVETQVYGAVQEWAKDARMNLSSFRYERTEKEKGFNKVTFIATGTGGMEQIGRFLFRIQTANIPVRITDLQIGTKKEGTDDLSLQVKIASVFEQPETPKPTGQAPARDAQASWN
jgi:hypothetical protein